MKISKYNALRFWEECYGSKQYAEDFHGNLMCKDGYGNNNFSVNYYGQKRSRQDLCAKLFAGSG